MSTPKKKAAIPSPPPASSPYLRGREEGHKFATGLGYDELADAIAGWKVAVREHIAEQRAKVAAAEDLLSNAQNTLEA